MSKIYDYLTECGMFFMATVKDDKPKLRPLGAFIEDEGKVIFSVGSFKEVYKQIVENPYVEIVACKKDGHWMRYSGKAVFEYKDKYLEMTLDKIPSLKNIYNEETGNKMAFFYLTEAVCVDIPIMGEGVSLL